MPGLLTQPLIFGAGMAFIGIAPGASYSMVPPDEPTPRRSVMGTIYGAAAVIAASQITIRAEDGGQNGG